MQVAFPETLRDAVALKRAEPDRIPMAGGTDLLVHWPENLEAHDASYVDLSGLEELRGIRWVDSALEIGAMATYWETLEDERVGRELPILHDAARTVGAIQIQSRGTWAGNIANASPAADGVPVLMACDAIVVLASANGRREVPLAAFYLDYKKTEARPDELIVAIRLPHRRYDVQQFHKVGTRKAQAIAKVGVAVTRHDGRWRVVASSMAPTVCRCPALEEILDEEMPVTGPGSLLEAIDADVTPIDDIRSTARYRQQVMSRVLYHALRDVCPAFS